MSKEVGHHQKLTHGGMILIKNFLKNNKIYHD